MTKELYLTKSSYVAGLSCPKLLWLEWHQRSPYVEPEPGSAQAVGAYVGEKACELFPGGVLIDAAPWEHEQAVERTRALMDDGEAPAIFEAAFEHDGVRIRVDILERAQEQESDRWHVHEVKSSTSVKPDHVLDLSVQVHVLLGCGVDIASAGIMHVNKAYVLGEDGIDWCGYFVRREFSGDIQDTLEDVQHNIAGHFEVLLSPEYPDIEIGPGCKSCDYWGVCTADKSEHWTETLPNLSTKKREELAELEVEDIRDIPEDFPLTAAQERMRQVILSGETFVSPDLWKALEPLGPPACYLDFETMAPAIPRYPGTSPFQQIPVQWSLHRMDEDGALTHEEFLAIGDVDPRRAFSESLIDALSGSDEPILVYSSYERTTINNMIKLFPDLKDELFAIIDRLRDLLPIVRGYVYHPDFKGSFSIKYVAPALAPGVDYGELNHVANGLEASAAFERIASGNLAAGENVTELRAAMLRYCELDTLAMVEVHKALKEMSKT